MSLRQHIPKPIKSTTLGQFLENIDSKTAIWYDLVNRPALQQSNSQQSSQQQFKPHTKARYAYSPSQRISINDGKSHAYLVDIDLNEYGVYEEEEEEALATL